MASHKINNGVKANEIFEGQVKLYKHMFAFLDSLCLKWCVDMNIPNIIHNHGQPMTLHELVSTLKVPLAKVSGVHRLMRYLAHLGFFDIVRIIQEDQEEKEEAYVLTYVSKLLVRGTDHCLSPMVDLILDPTVSTSYQQLGKWIHDEGNQTPFAMALDTDIWDFLSNNPTHMKYFNDATASDSQIINLALRDHGVVFEGLESIVDVAGGTGMVAKYLSETFPHLKCIVFDLPQVVKNLKESNNLSYVGGNMFHSIPKADAVLLKVCVFHQI
ncbi:Isoflavone 7-O-methyltransferase [Stylosanthes scabra]|uniref:Isoflavone 7-O-methyltransferase n=1 Tax=Stylosanthes scabra TaxID=79078 RepID=A0ABU6Q9E7_9FABA|nr:Isoflavone 7-O-methyltransferase [Stylosanthes scabra]